MKVMVCLKQVPHQDARLDVASDGSWIQEDNIKFEINSYDTYALEEALRIKDAGDAEVVVVSIGPDRVTQALRTALGMGADRAVHIWDDALAGADSLGIAKTLAAFARSESFDVVLTGLMADDSNFSMTGPMLAELLDIELFVIWIGTGCRFPSESVAVFIGMRSPVEKQGKLFR